jgi:beta-N-acetylhexosaminidase
VTDLNINPDNQIIAKYGRAFGKDAATVTKYALAFINAHHHAGLLTALKHFPGHGSSAADSHEGFVDITDTWQPQELQPYTDLIKAGYSDFVMVGHLIHRAYTQTKEQLPASLSYEWITGVLRGQLGFKGVVISDDLEMGAIRQHFKLKEVVTRAVMAGMDVLLFSNTADYSAKLGDTVRQILVEAAEADPAFKARIEESYARIVKLKAAIK